MKASVFLTGSSSSGASELDRMRQANNRQLHLSDLYISNQTEQQLLWLNLTHKVFHFSGKDAIVFYN